MEHNTPSDRSFNEINYNLTMLLGIASGQEQAIGKVANGLHSLEESVNSRFEEVKDRFHSLEESVNARFERVDARFDDVDARFKAQDEKLDQI